MSSAAAVANGASPGGNATGKRSLIGPIVVASGIGSVFEFYDFALFATATSLVFNKVFFIVPDPWFGVFLGFVTFAVGFLMTPIGAIVFGHLGDRIGRRRTLMVTFTMMGAASVLMGLLPDYHTIGLASPVLLLVLRLVNGLSRGGETGGAALLAIEHAPAHHRGLFGSFPALGSPLGAGLAILAFMPVLRLPEDQLIAWGWRIPFLLGGLLMIIGLVARYLVDETPVFEELKEHKSLSQHPMGDLFRLSAGRLLGGAGVMLGFNAFMYVLFTFLLSYGAEPVTAHGLGLPRTALTTAVLAGCGAHALMIILSCIISDHVGRRPVILAGAILLALYAFPLFMLFRGGGVRGAQVATVIGFALTGVMFGPILTYLSQLFPAAQRYSGVGLSFQIGAAIGGGLSPLIANRLLAATGTPLSISIYLLVMVAVSIVCLVVLPERYEKAAA